MEIISISSLLFVLFVTINCDLTNLNDYMVNIRHAKKKDYTSREDRYDDITQSYNEYDDYLGLSSTEDAIVNDLTTDSYSSEGTSVGNENLSYYPDTPINESFNYEMNDMKEDVVTKFLRIVESQHELGENCTAGTDLNLGEGVVDRYAQVNIE